ncbi:MAG: hypothetical protein AAF485_14655 [Chloroflexota bacterium]
MTTRTMPALPLRMLVSFLAIPITLTIVALLFGEGYVQPTFFPELALTDTRMPLILAGSLLMGVLIAIIYPAFHIDVAHYWFRNSLSVAVPFGLLVFFATHIVQAGYMLFPTTGWLLEGLYDSLAPMVAIVALSWLDHRHSRQLDLVASPTGETTVTYPSLLTRFLMGALVTAFSMMAVAGLIGDFLQAIYTAEFEPEAEPFELLITGWALMGFILAYLYPRFGIPTGEGWLPHALKIAVPIGLTVFLATHTIQAGYIRISGLGWVLQGLHDSLVPICTIVALAWLTNRQNRDDE